MKLNNQPLSSQRLSALRNIWTPIAATIAALIAVVAFISLRDSKEVQKQRQDYCLHILEPEACQVLVEQHQYAAISSCISAMSVDGICDLPIQHSLREMGGCVLELRNTEEQDPIPRSCLILSHE